MNLRQNRGMRRACAVAWMAFSLTLGFAQDDQVPSSISFAVQPSTTLVSAQIHPTVQVLVLETKGKKQKPIKGQAVTMTLGPNAPHPAILGGGLTQTTNSHGIASFSGLALDYFGSGYTLVATVATPTGPLTATSNPFNEIRVGDACLGPAPACSSGCLDSDGDGLNDAWEIAGGIDINGDGLISAKYDLLLPGADPSKPDVYVQYDWMDYGLPGNACTVDNDCAALQSGHSGETCTGPPMKAGRAGSCRYACTVDTDCSSRGVGHLLEKCVANSCLHTHDPEVTAQGALQAIVDSYAAHGINLHLIPGHALPHSPVVSYRQNSVMTDGCEGGSLASGTAGQGKYAESLYDLKAGSSLDPLKIAYHYALFGHYSGCDNLLDCSMCPSATNPDGSNKNQPIFGESGLAEVSGNDLVVSLGNREQDLRHEGGVIVEGNTFMHELGHNLGLRHGGGIDTPCASVGAACPHGGTCLATPIGKYCLNGEDTNAKPNFLSVMNYRYQFSGIVEGSAVGSSSPISCIRDTDCTAGSLCNHGSCVRLDYSTQTLPMSGNTPGYLDQSATPDSPAAGDPGLGLSESAGLSSGVADIFSFTDTREFGIPSFAPSDGPVEWDHDGDTSEQHIQVDTTCGPGGFADHPCMSLQYPQLNGHTDWGPAGQNEFTYKFQCTPYGGPTGDGAAPPEAVAYDQSAEQAIAAHVMFPPRQIEIAIRPTCPAVRKPIAPGQSGTVTVAFMGSSSFDVNEIDLTSLNFYGAKPSATSIRDVNADGVPDLLVDFDMSGMTLHPNAKSAKVSGWLKDSQIIFGSGEIVVLPSMDGVEHACR